MKLSDVPTVDLARMLVTTENASGADTQAVNALRRELERRKRASGSEVVDAYWLEIYEIGSDDMRLPTKLYWDSADAGDAGQACMADEMLGTKTVRAIDVVRVSITRHPTANGVEKE